MTRLWPQGIPVDAFIDPDGAPVGFVWDGRYHTVTHIANHWRVDWGWWHWHIWRDVFKLTTDTGLLVELVGDRLTGQWCIQRLYD
jgi:hypothetical protein